MYFSLGHRGLQSSRLRRRSTQELRRKAVAKQRRNGYEKIRPSLFQKFKLGKKIRRGWRFRFRNPLPSVRAGKSETVCEGFFATPQIGGRDFARCGIGPQRGERGAA